MKVVTIFQTGFGWHFAMPQEVHSLTRTFLMLFHDQLWKHIVSVSGDHHKTLDLVFCSISGTLNRTSTDKLFSIYATAQTARLTGLNLPSALGLGRGRGKGIRHSEILSEWTTISKQRPVIWDRMERTALSRLSFNSETYQQDIEILLLKSEKIADAFKIYPRYIEDQKFNRWLLTLRQEYAGQLFTYEDAMTLARDSGVDIAFLLDDWLVNDTLAGF